MDIACPLSKLTVKDQIFKWRDLCQSAFEMLKDKLCHEPILKYPDTSKPYTLFTDISNYGWAGVLRQETEMSVPHYIQWHTSADSSEAVN